MKTVSRIPTQDASAYIRKLCRHFAHKIETSYSESEGSASFPMGVCRMTAAPGLLIFEVEAETSEAIGKIRDILVTHLLKFAFREELQIAWTDPEEEAAGEMEELARQLRAPEGENGIRTALNMNRANAGMTRRSVALMHLQAGDRVLEIGPGNGAFVPELLSAAENISYTGADISETMIAEAKKLNAAEPRARFGLTDGRHLGFPDQAFDKIFTVNTLYFWADPVAYAREIKRVLRKDGVFCLAFAARDFMEKLPFVKYHFRLFDGEEGVRVLEDAGFAVREVISETETVQGNMGNPVERRVIFILATRPG